MKMYLDNAATTKPAKQVVEAMNLFLTKEYGNPSSLHFKGIKAKEALEEARNVIAKKLNAETEEIIFTCSGTEANNLAIKGIAFANKDKGNHIITTKIEHPCILESCKFLESQGFEVTYLDVDKEGFIDSNQLKKAITKDTILVSIIHGNNEIGTLQDLEKISNIVKEKNIYFHTDACQSFTKIDIDVKKLTLDLVTINAHKIHGPKGAAALYIKKNTNIQKQMHGGSHEQNLRAATENIPAIMGFAKAVELMQDKDIAFMAELKDYLIKKVKENFPEAKLNGPERKRLCNHASFSFPHLSGEAILLELSNKGIAVGTGSACSSKADGPSHVLTAIGLEDSEANSTIRITLSKENTKEDIDSLIKALKPIIEELKELNPK